MRSKEELQHDITVLCKLIEALKSAGKCVLDGKLRSSCYDTIDNATWDLIDKYEKLKKLENET